MAGGTGQRRSARSPARLFEAALSEAGARELFALGLEVVGRPGRPAPGRVLPEDILVRRATAEDRLALRYRVKGGAERRESLESRGVPCEGRRAGLFVEAFGDQGGRFAGRARRIADLDGRMAEDTVLLRRIPAIEVEDLTPRRMSWEDEDEPPAPEEDGSPAALLLAAIYALRPRGTRPLREEYLRSVLETGTGAGSLRDEVSNAAAELGRRMGEIPAGADRAARVQALLDAEAARLLTLAERRFILDPQRSTLELLPPAERDRYLPFAWAAPDFPGGPPGPNEARATEMFAALSRLRPERRANRDQTAVVRRDEFDSRMQARVAAGLTRVTGEARHQLQRDAAAAYVQMRTAAAAEGVTLSIRDSHRPLETAQANAAAAGNATAVASFSSHTLGLAIDFTMSHSGLTFREISTRPFQNLVDMYRSPVHKWMFLRGETHGWYPYRPEPWHWEYNPPGYRDRFRAPAAPATAGPTTATPPTSTAPPASSTPPPARAEGEVFTEAATDPVAPVRPALALGAGVGRGGRNRPADVRAVQARLVELRVLGAADAAAEQPAGSGAVPEAALGRTIAAIESFQRRMGTTESGQVDSRGTTRADLDRAIPEPTAAEYTAAATRRAAIALVARRAFSITGPVGAVDSGNAPADVAAVQRRLVELCLLDPAHREAPAAGATDPVPRARLAATIAALRRYQADVRFWVGRRVVSGAVTADAVAPGDATAALMAAVTTYDVTSGSDRLCFHDHVRSGHTRSEIGVMFAGTASPDAIPQADYETLGLTADQARALRFVSHHEGNFDALNTYDRAVVSVGFIQFAGGGRGLGPYLALLKSRRPARFQALLGDLGLEVEFEVSAGSIRAESARLVVFDPAGSRVRRASAAETAVREDKRLSAALILSGRDRQVQLCQIEAAIRDYVLPALDGQASWGGVRAPLRDLVRTRRGLAMLFDRCIQEGVGGGRRRFERVIQALHAARPAASAAALQAREAEVLEAVEQDLQAGVTLEAQINEARGHLLTLHQAAERPGAAVPALLGRPELGQARAAVGQALSTLASVVNVAPPARSTVDATLRSMEATLRAETTRLAFAPAPPSPPAVASALEQARAALAIVAAPVVNNAGFLGRIRRIRQSNLDSSLTEIAEAFTVAAAVSAESPSVALPGENREDAALEVGV